MSNTQVIIASYPEATVAHPARVRLDAEGFDSWQVDESIASVNPLYSQVIGGVKLAVRGDDVLTATGVIQGTGATELGRYQQSLLQCPMCGSMRVGENAMRFVWLLLLTLLTFGIYLMMFHRRHKCRDFGSVW